MIAIERVFLHRNPDSALKLGQARGVALCAAASCGADVFEYAPRAIKMAVTGYGAAAKPQVAQMVCTLLQLRTTLAADAADALAAALCHSQTRRIGSLGAAATAIATAVHGARVSAPAVGVAAVSVADAPEALGTPLSMRRADTR
jgi:crossover junction endodeoxyribonuclease RuvC